MSDALMYAIVGLIISLWFGAMEWRMRKIEQKTKEIPTRAEVKERLQVQEDKFIAAQTELSADIKEIKDILRKLIGY